VTAEITEAIADAGNGQLKRGNIPIPEFGLSAMWTAGVGIGFPGVRVAYDSALTFTEEEWEHHWKMAALQVKDTVEGKGKKNYESPSIAVVDISRLGETSRMLGADGIPRYQQTLVIRRLQPGQAPRCAARPDDSDLAGHRTTVHLH